MAGQKIDAVAAGKGKSVLCVAYIFRSGALGAGVAATTPTTSSATAVNSTVRCILQIKRDRTISPERESHVQDEKNLFRAAGRRALLTYSENIRGMRYVPFQSYVATRK